VAWSIFDLDMTSMVWANGPDEAEGICDFSVAVSAELVCERHFDGCASGDCDVAEGLDIVHFESEVDG